MRLAHEGVPEHPHADLVDLASRHSARDTTALVKTSLGIWALGPMVTRFVPGGYQPQWADETMPERVRRAVDGLGDLIDDYEFHYPQELGGEPRRGARRPGRPRHLRVATGTPPTRSSARAALLPGRRRPRRRARRGARGADFAGSIGAQMILWPGIEGYNYPFQTPYGDAWARFVDGVGEVATRCQRSGITLFLEHKNSEPAMKILMRNIGMTLHVIHTLRARASRTSRSTWTGSTCS